jgi:hypothetical protein
MRVRAGLNLKRSTQKSFSYPQVAVGNSEHGKIKLIGEKTPDDVRG